MARVPWDVNGKGRICFFAGFTLGWGIETILNELSEKVMVVFYSSIPEVDRAGRIALLSASR